MTSPLHHPDTDHPDNDRHEPDRREPDRGEPDRREPDRREPDQTEPDRDAPGPDAPYPDDDDLTVAERREEPPELDAEDEAELAAMDSFPASDPPSFTPSRAGPANATPVTTKDDDTQER